MSYLDGINRSDLDGDEYCVIWDQELLLDHNEEPFDFAVPKRVDTEIKDEVQEKMSDFYIKYMTQDAVGTISNAFLVASDLFGINHKVCMDLAKKNSEAVDFTKSGRPPAPLTKEWTLDEITNEEIPPERSERQPDYMAGDTNRPTYESPRLLGKLHREIRKIEDVMKIAEDKDEQIPIELDPYLHVDGWEEYQEEADEALAAYNSILRTMMETHGIRTEAEIFSGCITDMRNRLSDKDQDDMSFFNTNQIIETKVTNLYKKSRASFFESFGGWRTCTEKVDKPFADEENVCHRECKNPTVAMQRKAVAYYIRCYERARNTGERKLSFAWLPYEVLAHVKQEKIRSQPYAITGNPLFKLLEEHMNNYINENQKQFEQFCKFEGGSVLSIATEPLAKYCRQYNGLDKLLFIVHEWGRNLHLYTYRFSSRHLSMLVIMYFTNAFASLDGDALQILEPIPLKKSIEELEPQVFGNQPRLLLKFLEFLSSRKFGGLSHINFRVLGVQAIFCRGEWMPFHNAAMTTYHNMIYNLRFEELPLKRNEQIIKKEIIRECEPFTIELPEDLPVPEKDIEDKMKEKSGAVEVHLRRMLRNKVLISARGTLEALDRLRRLTTVRPPLSTGARGREIIQQLFTLVYDNIMKEEIIEELDRIVYDECNQQLLTNEEN